MAQHEMGVLTSTHDNFVRRWGILTVEKIANLEIHVVHIVDPHTQITLRPFMSVFTLKISSNKRRLVT